MKATVIGGGLAGCEAAWQLAKYGIHVDLYEMKPKKKSPAHSLDYLGELVCSNSLRADTLENGAGLLKAEMRLLGSLVTECADATRVPAGGALAVDRLGFAQMMTEKIHSHPNITVIEEEVTEIPDEGCVVVASGPLTSDALADNISKLCKEQLYFFDAAAPIITYESIDKTKTYRKARYDKGTADYINCPMTKEEYLRFYNALITAETAELKSFEDQKVFEGCMPVEVMARRGEDTLVFGPLKPVGLEHPETGEQYYAVVQLRQDDKDGTLFNIVGFQTHLKFGEQKRVFSMIPGLENLDIIRYGVMHRNTYLHSPGFLDTTYGVIERPGLFFAGQMTGVEGYVESASSGIVAGINAARYVLGKAPLIFPSKTATGALAKHVSAFCGKDFQPMNINFGIIDSLDYRVKNKKERYGKISERALEVIREIIKEEL
ncbi:MAG: methylenetetrahydrofolate--tRNA-(uracil(54)-C(5))-methyltransferase (FADH(2)-oxidizing) TrmFO [Clostridia bacterium]|nr:methylenetetrahydrofolate--tRNA-(uracil(54)-C(5))-methyltransferase (FADH(2)-oxidizing) TrmFO [Clostridia bacterium]